ncbi:hypothetical protein [Tepidibacillus sp. LV47]|uniref:hypothetical protein n=1 Tax=Tepidibacillus sp. LV47 TaxID=3398228 RepID=UPI003AAE5D12
MGKKRVLYWLILALFIIGVAQSIRINPSGILIPLIVFSTIYYFYKHPEKMNWILNRNLSHYSRQMKGAKKRRISRFTVIKGNKDDKKP